MISLAQLLCVDSNISRGIKIFSLWWWGTHFRPSSSFISLLNCRITLLATNKWSHVEKSIKHSQSLIRFTVPILKFSSFFLVCQSLSPALIIILFPSSLILHMNDIFLFIYLSTYLSIYLSIYHYITWSIHLSISSLPTFFFTLPSYLSLSTLFFSLFSSSFYHLFISLSFHFFFPLFSFFPLQLIIKNS